MFVWVEVIKLNHVDSRAVFVDVSMSVVVDTGISIVIVVMRIYTCANSIHIVNL